MNLLYKRPLFGFCFAFVVGSAFFFSFSELFLAITLLCFIALFAVLFFIRRFAKATLFLVMGFVFAAFFSLCALHLQYASLATYNEKEVDLSFTVLEIRERNENGDVISVNTYVHTINEEVASVKACVTFEKGTKLSVGDVFKGSGELYYLTPVENGLLMAEGNRLAFIALRMNRTGSVPVLAQLASIRNTLDARIRSAGDGDSAALLAAILFGYRDNLSAKLEVNFRQTGFTHAIAVSGLNLTILVGIVLFLLKLLRVPRFARNAAAILFAILYAALSGFSPSVVRAAFMSCIVLASFLFRRPHDPLTSLSFAAAILLLFEPTLAANASYLLSVMATYGLIVVGDMLRTRDKTAKNLLRSLLHEIVSKEEFLLSFGAIAATLLLSATMFGSLSVLAPVSTALLSILVTIILWLSVPLLLFPESLIGKVADAIAEALVFSVDRLADIPYTVISLSFEFIPPLIFAATAITVVLLLGKKRKKRIIVLPFLILTLVIGITQCVHNATLASAEPVTYVAEGSSEAIIYTSGHTSILVDTSNGSIYFTAAVCKQITSLHMTELSALALTGYADGHENFVRSIGDAVKVRRLLLPIPRNADETELSHTVIRAADEFGIPYEFYRDGEEIAVNAVSLVADRTKSKRSEVVYSLLSRENRLTYVSSGYHLWGNFDTAAALVEKSRCVIVGAYASEAPIYIPYSLSDGLRTVVWSDTAVTEWRGEENASILRKAEVAFNPSRHSFSLAAP